jgi:hypothetical protein
MDIEAFERYLKKGGRSPSAVQRCLKYVAEFERFLSDQVARKTLEDASPEDLQQFVAEVESQPKTSAKTQLWGIKYYFDYTKNEDMKRLASLMREQRIKRHPFSLKDFRGVDTECIKALSIVGIKNVDQMLTAGKTPGDRANLSSQIGVPEETILELVKLSDLARVPGIKGIRARLYVDAGIDSIEELAQWDAVEFREHIVEFVERTGFDGIPTLPAEARFSIDNAKKLPKIIEY